MAQEHAGGAQGHEVDDVTATPALLGGDGTPAVHSVRVLLSPRSINRLRRSNSLSASGSSRRSHSHSRSQSRSRHSRAGRSGHTDSSIPISGSADQATGPAAYPTEDGPLGAGAGAGAGSRILGRGYESAGLPTAIDIRIDQAIHMLEALKTTPSPKHAPVLTHAAPPAPNPNANLIFARESSQPAPAGPSFLQQPLLVGQWNSTNSGSATVARGIGASGSARHSIIHRDTSPELPSSYSKYYTNSLGGTGLTPSEMVRSRLPSDASVQEGSHRSTSASAHRSHRDQRYPQAAASASGSERDGRLSMQSHSSARHSGSSARRSVSRKHAHAHARGRKSARGASTSTASGSPRRSASHRHRPSQESGLNSTAGTGTGTGTFASGGHSRSRSFSQGLGPAELATAHSFLRHSLQRADPTDGTQSQTSLSMPVVRQDAPVFAPMHQQVYYNPLSTGTPATTPATTAFTGAGSVVPSQFYPYRQ